MNSNKTEDETRQLIQLKIAELEEKSALLKDYTWLLKVSVSALDLLMILLRSGYTPSPLLPACTLHHDCATHKSLYGSM